MKIKLTRPFQYQASPTKVVTLSPGVHDVSAELAEKAHKWGGAILIVGKKAPKNKKRGRTPENKARMEE